MSYGSGRPTAGGRRRRSRAAVLPASQRGVAPPCVGRSAAAKRGRVALGESAHRPRDVAGAQRIVRELIEKIVSSEGGDGKGASARSQTYARKAAAAAQVKEAADNASARVLTGMSLTAASNGAFTAKITPTAGAYFTSR